MSKRLLDMPKIEAFMTSFVVPAPLLTTTRYTRVAGPLGGYDTQFGSSVTLDCGVFAVIRSNLPSSNVRRKLRLSVVIVWGNRGLPQCKAQVFGPSERPPISSLMSQQPCFLYQNGFGDFVY